MAEQWRWANAQNALFPTYAALVTASGHMRAEYLRNGAAPARVHALPLFPTLAGEPAPAPEAFRVVFLGRMTAVKGGDILLRALALAGARLGRPLPVTLAGDGPRRAEWERLAARLGVEATFTGWVDDDARAEVLRTASLLAVPSVWPEPFGLVGLEAGVLGVPAAAFDVGGISDWLHDGVNGYLVPDHPPRAEALADALVHAATHPDALARLRAGARERAEALSLPAHLDRLEPILAAAGAARVA